MRTNLFAIAICLLCANLSAADAKAEPAAKEMKREFKPFKCRYTLPGPDWEWMDNAITPETVFAAKSEDGYIVLLTTVAIDPRIIISKPFMTGADQGITQQGLMKIRSSKMTTFKTLPCYQQNLTLVGTNQTCVNRMVLGHGKSYSLQIIGDDKPVENSPVFEAAMNGFDFTQMPSPPPPTTTETPISDDEKAGRIAGYVVIGAIVLYFLLKNKS